jgi:N4-(beta-N-acetylglucosaminyl)-L-asparaginase
MEPLALNVGLKPQWTWRASYDALFPAEDPLYVAALNQNNEMSSAATTSGMPWRQRGLASGIASLGAGCFLDSEVGCAGAGGSSSANLKAAGARVIVDNMRAGLSPEEAGMDALNRIVRWYRNDMSALRFIEIMYYVLRKDGAYAGVSLWQGDKTGHERQFTIHDGVRRAESFRFLLQGSPAEPMGIG